MKKAHPMLVEVAFVDCPECGDCTQLEDECYGEGDSCEGCDAEFTLTHTEDAE